MGKKDYDGPAPAASKKPEQKSDIVIECNGDKSGDEPFETDALKKVEDIIWPEKESPFDSIREMVRMNNAGLIKKCPKCNDKRSKRDVYCYECDAELVEVKEEKDLCECGNELVHWQKFCTECRKKSPFYEQRQKECEEKYKQKSEDAMEELSKSVKKGLGDFSGKLKYEPDESFVDFVSELLDEALEVVDKVLSPPYRLIRKLLTKK